MKKKIKSLCYKIFILLNQRTFKTKNGKKIKYIFFNKKSEELIVLFSGFSPKDQKPKYNYIKTLRNIKKNQLFILDRFGYKQVGTYYLGENGDYFLEDEILALVNKIKQVHKIKKVYTAGTSKGRMGKFILWHFIKKQYDYLWSSTILHR